MTQNPHPERPNANHQWRKRLSDLKVEWRLLVEDTGDPEQTAIALKERVKELNCLYAISQLIERENCALEEFLAMAVDILPPSVQYPEIACARISMDNRDYDSLYFETSPWFLSSPIHFQGKLVGEVTVYYTQPCPMQDEGPFLQEERHFLDELETGVTAAHGGRKKGAPFAEEIGEILREAMGSMKAL